MSNYLRVWNFTMWKLSQKYMNELFDKNWVSAILLEVIRIYSFWVGEQLAMGLKLHQVKALWDSCSAEISWRSKISSKSLYVARFSKY